MREDEGGSLDSASSAGGSDHVERGTRAAPHGPRVPRVFGEPSATRAPSVPPSLPPSPAAQEQPTPAVDAEPAPITDEEFEEWVEEALERVPPQFTEAVENCAFIVEHEPPPGRGTLLGLYHGVPLTERGYYSGAMPDSITIYQNPLIRVYRTREAVKEQVYRTVVHEIGHYFGLDDHELHGLGW